MAVKKGAMDAFLKPSSHYADNKKAMREIFIDKTEDDLKPDPQNFLETKIYGESKGHTYEELIAKIEGRRAAKNVPSSLPLENTIQELQTQSTPSPIPTEANTNLHSVEPVIEFIQPSSILRHSDYSLESHDDGVNLRQTKDKLETNIGQSEDKHKTNVRQTKDKVETNKRQTKDKLRTVLETELETKTDHGNLRQTWDKLETREISERLEHLSDLKKNVLLFIYKECQSVLDSRTPRLTIDYVAGTCKAPIPSVRKIIQRLEEDGIISRPDYKDGRGGWTIYELHKKIYDVIHGLESSGKLETILRQAKKLETVLETELETNSSSSSSFKDLKETTTTELDDEWNFDITPYARVGFTSTQIKQLASLSVISAVDVEQSLIEFSYDLDNNALPPIKTTKLRFLMGLLRAGQSYVSEGFKNEQDAMIAEMASRASRKREGLLNAKFEAWVSELNDEDTKKIESRLPTHLIVLWRAHGINNADVKSWLFNYYANLP